MIEKPKTLGAEAIEKMKRLVKYATPTPWATTEGAGYMPILYQMVQIGSLDHTDIHMVIALRNLAPELIALWKAAKEFQEVEGHFIMDTWGDAADALQALETKAAEVLK